MNLIKKMWEGSGLTKTDAAKKIGIPRQNLHILMTNYPNISMRSLFRVAKALGYKLKVDVVKDSSNQNKS